jgi:hypothetical protein
MAAGALAHKDTTAQARTRVGVMQPANLLAITKTKMQVTDEN